MTEPTATFASCAGTACGTLAHGAPLSAGRDRAAAAALVTPRHSGRSAFSPPATSREITTRSLQGPLYPDVGLPAPRSTGRNGRHLQGNLLPLDHAPGGRTPPGGGGDHVISAALTVGASLRVDHEHLGLLRRQSTLPDGHPEKQRPIVGLQHLPEGVGYLFCVRALKQIPGQRQPLLRADDLPTPPKIASRVAQVCLRTPYSLIDFSRRTQRRASTASIPSEPHREPGHDRSRQSTRRQPPAILRAALEPPRRMSQPRRASESLFLLRYVGVGELTGRLQDPSGEAVADVSSKLLYDVPTVVAYGKVGPARRLSRILSLSLTVCFRANHGRPPRSTGPQGDPRRGRSSDWPPVAELCLDLRTTAAASTSPVITVVLRPVPLAVKPLYLVRDARRTTASSLAAVNRSATSDSGKSKRMTSASTPKTRARSRCSERIT